MLNIFMYSRNDSPLGLFVLILQERKTRCG